MRFVMAGRDFRQHSTIQEGSYPGNASDIKGREAIYREIATCDALEEIIDRNDGQKYYIRSLDS
jgi:hypothetical protein